MIGLGNIAVRGHVPAYASEGVRPRLQIVSVLDVVEHNREKAAEHLPGALFYTDLQKLLDAEKLDFVDICTPPHTHEEYIKACAGRGLHIICEKPLVHRTEALHAAVGAIESSGVVFMPCHQYKYSPLWRAIKEIIDDGTIGDVTVAQFNVYRLHADSGTAAWNPEWRTNKLQSGGGILVDTGAHYFYLTQFFFGVPRTVSSVLRTLKHAAYGVEDTAMVTLEYDRHLIQINLTWAASHRANSVYIAGTLGSLSYDGSKVLLSSTDGVKEIPMPDVSDKKQYVSWYASLFLEFASRIKEKNYAHDQLCEAMNVMKLLDLSYRANDEHRVFKFE